MKIGDLVLYQGRHYYLRGLDPMSVPKRRLSSKTRRRAARTGKKNRAAGRRAHPRARRSLTRYPLAMIGAGDEALMHEMVIYGVSFDIVGKQPIVLLKTADGNKFLPIWIGHPEAAAILMKLQGATTPRPMTHDLRHRRCSAELDAQVVADHGHRAAREHLLRRASRSSRTARRSRSTRARPTRSPSPFAPQAPIFAADDVIEESAIEFEGEEVNEEEIVDEFAQLPRPRHPDEFAEATGEEEA